MWKYPTHNFFPFLTESIKGYRLAMMFIDHSLQLIEWIQNDNNTRGFEEIQLDISSANEDLADDLIQKTVFRWCLYSENPDNLAQDLEVTLTLSMVTFPNMEQYGLLSYFDVDQGDALHQEHYKLVNVHKGTEFELHLEGEDDVRLMKIKIAKIT
uniref:Uncharacterized protein n=1 Tax=Ditylenchus dipsaci TaxID=166011 RepID=A0A915E145_9BILA